MIIFITVLRSADSAGLSEDIGITIGYSYIGLTLFFLCSLSIILILKPYIKGLLPSILSLIMFTQFTRYSILINFSKSEFYLQVFKTFSLSQDPYEINYESSKRNPWSLLGYTSTNFITNSFAHLAIICLIFLIWISLLPLHLKKNLKYFKDVFIFVAYYSATDLTFSSFLQLKYVQVDTGYNLIALILSVVYLLTVIILLFFQIFFIYRSSTSFLVRMIKEEFEEEKEYFYYFYYPTRLFKVILNSCLLAFTQDRPYTVPIVISIINLINFSYIISIRPFATSKVLVLACILQFIEILVMYLPILYEFQTLSYFYIDLISILLFFSGLLIISIKVLFILRNFSATQSKIQNNEGNNLNSEHMNNVDESSMMENEQETHNLSGFLHTFKTPAGNETKSEKVRQDVQSSYSESVNERQGNKKGSYFLKNFNRSRFANDKTVKENDREPNGSLARNEEEEHIGTARFALSSCNSERKIPENTPVGSKKLFIPHLSDDGSRHESVDKIRHNVSHDITPVSAFSSGKRLNLNDFTVKYKKDNQSEGYFS